MLNNKNKALEEAVAALVKQVLILLPLFFVSSALPFAFPHALCCLTFDI